tara:strand:+ start:4883 stop:5680 length:798 start_codon:yes stop_codon:yes gene_type:complete
MKAFKYQFDKIVVGGNLGALSYCCKHNIPLLINRADPPRRFEPDKSELWDKLYFLLSLSGLNLLGDMASTVRILGNELSVATKGLKNIKMNFNELTVFDDRFVTGLPMPIKEKNEFIVLDWMDATRCTSHNYKHLFTKNNFVKEVHFYPTDRIDGNHTNKKDLVAVSYLTKEQLQNFEYSDTYARFKVEKLLKENGIIGSKNGFQNGKPINYALKLKVKKRETQKRYMHLYNDTENIKFKYENTLQNKISHLEYISKLNNMLGAI